MKNVTNLLEKKTSAFNRLDKKNLQNVCGGVRVIYNTATGIFTIIMD